MIVRVVVVLAALASLPLLMLTASCGDTGPSPIADHPDASPDADARTPPADQPAGR
jgi:hypothetical protein